MTGTDDDRRAEAATPTEDDWREAASATLALMLSSMDDLDAASARGFARAYADLNDREFRIPLDAIRIYRDGHPLLDEVAAALKGRDEG